MGFISSNESLGANGEAIVGTISPGSADNVVGLVFSNQGGTLHIEQSANGTNWDFDTEVVIVASVGKGFSVPVYAPYVRLRYVNGATAQTAFRLTAKTSSAGPR
jgi:hypothetical protein